MKFFLDTANLDELKKAADWGIVNGVTTNPQLLHDVADPANNEAAWKTFLERYQPLIRGWCCRGSPPTASAGQPGRHRSG